MLHWTELRDWQAIRRNRPATARADAGTFWSLFANTNGSAPATVQKAAQSETDLLVVITTYRRPDACSRLLRQLTHALVRARTERVHVLVINDASDVDYTPVRKLAGDIFGASITWLDATARLGKPGFWRVYQTAFLAAELLRPAHALFLQDDVEFAVDLLRRVGEQWERTASDEQRRVLYLLSCPDDEPNGRWVKFARTSGPAGLRLTQWFDLQAFYVDLAFFELLQFQMIEIHPNRWLRKPNTSSGVGRQLTLRLFERANVYQSYPTLALHGGMASEMNPGAREKRSLDNRVTQQPQVGRARSDGVLVTR